MFAGNIDWQLKASDIPVIRDAKRLPFGHDAAKLNAEITDVSTAIENLETRLVSDKEKVLSSLDPIRNPNLVRHMDSVPRLLTNAFKDPRLDAHLKNLPEKTKTSLPQGVVTDGVVDREKFVTLVRATIRNGIMNGTLTIEALKNAVAWYKMPEGDLPMFEARLSHAASLAEKRREIAHALEAGTVLKLADYGPTASGNPMVVEAASSYAKSSQELATLKSKLATIRATLEAPNTVSRSAVDMMIDFVASRADFRSSFGPNFRNTVFAGFARYPEMVEVEVNGKKLDMKAELVAFKAGKPLTVVTPADSVRLTGPMMLDGEIQATHEDEARAKRMNARTRFFYEFASTIYLPTEVLTPKEDTLPERTDFDGPESDLSQKYLYSLRHGDTLVSVLKNRIARYEGISASDPKRVQKINEHYKWQLRGLKMDGFMQTESEFNPGAVNENRIIPYYDVRTVPAVWKKYLADRRIADLEFERTVAIPYLRVSTIDGAGIDTKRKLFREITDRIQASESRMVELPALREVLSFNDFQYELFMKRFFERSLNDSKASESSDFFRDIRPNRNFYIRYEDLADIAAEISDATALSVPELKAVDSDVIDAVIKNRHNASLAKNILATETYAVEGGTGFRTVLKRLGGKSKGDFQIRLIELTDYETVVKGGKVYRVEAGKEVPVEWPSLKNLRDAAGAVFTEGISKIAAKRLGGTAYESFVNDAKEMDRLRAIIAQDEISPKDMKRFVKGAVALMRIDSGDASNLVGKTFSAALLDSKVALHYRKTAFWLSEMGVPFEYLADSDEERSKYERTVGLVNNLSEDKVLLALLENSIIRIMGDALSFPIAPKDVYAKPTNPIKKIYQEVKHQIYYDRPLFFAHFDEYLASAKFALSIDERFLQLKTGEVSPEKVAKRREMLAALEEYRTSMAVSKNFNAEAFKFFRDARFRKLLSEAGLPWTPFPTAEEFSKDAFRSSVFNYVAKMERRIKRENEKKASNPVKPKA